MKERLSVGWVVVGLLALGASTASASAGAADMTKEGCIDANTKGQDLRRGGHLLAARGQFRVCAAAACPALVRDDCARRLDEVDKMQPTVIFAAKDSAGKDLSSVTVTVDGEKLADKLDGSDLPVDPGEHVFTFTVAGQSPTRTTLVVSAGEKARRQVVVLGAHTGGPVAAAPPKGDAETVPGHLVVAADDGATVSIDGQPVGRGRFDGPEAAGPHSISVVATGMRPYKADVDLKPGETRTLQIALEPEHGAPVWPWVVGGVALAAGAAVGGYFLFRPQDQPGAPPSGKLGTVFISNSFGAAR